MILSFQNCSKDFTTASQKLSILSDINLDILPGQTVAIAGASGSGKTTMLSLAAGLDLATSGTVKLLDHDLAQCSDEQRAKLRAVHIGFIFQNFQLLPSLTALENITTAAELAGVKITHSEAVSWLDKVGLASRATHYPQQLSGGEQQRVAVARALARKPVLVLADEPTGNLDRETATHIEALIFSLQESLGFSLLLSTHDLQLASRCRSQFQIVKRTLAAMEH